jgi:hypothetical protein
VLLQLPLVVHGRFGIQFVGDGELHLYLVSAAMI